MKGPISFHNTNGATESRTGSNNTKTQRFLKKRFLLLKVRKNRHKYSWLCRKYFLTWTSHSVLWSRSFNSQCGLKIGQNSKKAQNDCVSLNFHPDAYIKKSFRTFWWHGLSDEEGKFWRSLILTIQLAQRTKNWFE